MHVIVSSGAIFEATVFQLFIQVAFQSNQNFKRTYLPCHHCVRVLFTHSNLQRTLLLKIHSLYSPDFWQLASILFGAVIEIRTQLCSRCWRRRRRNMLEEVKDGLTLFLDWTYGGVNFTGPGNNGGEHCRDHVSDEHRVVETVIGLVFSLVSGLIGYR